MFFHPSRLFMFLAVFWAVCTGCQTEAPPDWQREKAALELRLAALQQYYDRMQCVKDALAALQLVDNCLDYGTSLERYQLNIVAAQTRLEALSCDQAGKTAMTSILDYHYLASRLWQARSQGQGGELAADFVTVVWPLWRQFELPPPPALSLSLIQGLDQYAQAAEPVARQILNQLGLALRNPAILDYLAQNANQVLWHQAHEELAQLRNKLWEGRDLSVYLPK